jgi:endonuclease/exonuclease/phosphatase family metal-dependent hydrolase
MSGTSGNDGSMRVATFNILNGRTSSDDQVDLGVFRAALTSLDADVLALQEVDRNQPRSGRTDLTEAAADAMGAVDHRFVAALSGSPGATWMAATGREQPDAAAYGIALLSRYPVSAWQVIRLPALGVRVPMWFRGNRLPTLVRDEPRVAVAALIDGPDGPLTVATTHLSFVPWWNGRQLRTLVTSLSGVDHPMLLMGDLNMGPARAAALTGMRGLVDAPTFPADAPREQLDHVLGDGTVRATQAEARRLPISDHRALVVDLA